MIIDFTDRSLYVSRVGEVTTALYNPKIRYILLRGGAGAGKSYLATQLILQNIIDGVRVAIFRKVSSTLRASCLQMMQDVKSEWEIPDSLFEIIPTIKELRSPKGLGMMFGLDDPEKIKSLANFDRAWIEEATELTYDDFTQIDLRLRGGVNHKVICSFNPVTAKSRLKTEIEDHPEKRPNAVWISKTARDNRFVDKHYLASLDALKEKNEAKWRIYAKNLRGEGLKGSIYPEYEIFDYNIAPDYIGLDFGFNDPNAITYVKREDKEDIRDLYVQEMAYCSGQTSTELIKEMNRINIPKDILIVADSARPEMIADIKKAGYNIIGVNKYKGSKNEQIDFVKTHKLHINGPNLLKEVSEYVWKLDKNGEPMDIPQDGEDHLLDSMIYACTQYKKSGFYFETI